MPAARLPEAAPGSSAPVDLLAGKRYPCSVPLSSSHPTVLVFDSGLGGLTVHRHVVSLLPQARYVYVADTAGFPYGAWPEERLIDRIIALFDGLIAGLAPDLAVIACNTASTLVLPHLRRRFAIPFVGTVPAIKPAAAASQSRIIAVLATPGTVNRDYTHDLVRMHAGNCRVELVGAKHLAGLAERAMRGEAPDESAIIQEIAPCFVAASDGARTDTVVLACTHYPLLLPFLERLAPWPVTFVDPAPAIARRVATLLPAAAGAINARMRLPGKNASSERDSREGVGSAFGEGAEGGLALFTGAGAADEALRRVPLLGACGFSRAAHWAADLPEGSRALGPC